MQNDQYEKLRLKYKPNKVEILFVGESKPQQGTFFYRADSNLYRETEKAFNEYFGKKVFSLEVFKSCGCWLYDICEKPVNGLKRGERKAEIRRGIHDLVSTVKIRES